MTDRLNAKIYGIPEFSARLRALSADMQRKVVRAGALAAATDFRNAAKANAPQSRVSRGRGHTPGQLKRAIVAGRAKNRSKPGIEAYTVVVRAGKARRKNQSSAFYWRWVEAGHLVRGPGKKLQGGDKSRALQRQRLQASGAKYVPPNAFLLRAFRARQGQAVAAFNKRIEVRIQKATRDLNVR